MKTSPSSLGCAGCGWTTPPAEVERYPFRCARAGTGDVDHVVTRTLDTFRVEFMRGDDPNPFIRHRELLHSYHVARRRGVTDDGWVEMLRGLDDAVAAVDGRGFRTTPFSRHEALDGRLGFEGAGGVWVKDETGNVSGSHKARHLMGIMAYLRVVERRELPPLAIASCGNAALAAAVIARAVGRELRVFVPPTADSSVLERLRALGAVIRTCPREPGAVGDPCYHGFREAVAAGALPFCVQGNENGMTIEGGETIGYEMLTALGDTELDHVVVQVGGGALASSCIAAFTLAHRMGRVRKLPRFHMVQTAGAAPLKRAYELVVARTEAPSGGTVEQELRYAVAHRSQFMWPWEEEPRSVARGILDDETYDWMAVLRGMLASDGLPVVVGEDTLKEANSLARTATGIPVCHTGSAGLAGLLQLRRDGIVANDDAVAVIFSGADRSPGG